MKIFYSASNRIGSGIQLSRILKNCDNYIFKTAAYSSAINFIPSIDYTLDFYSSFFHEMPSISSLLKGKITKEIEWLCEEIKLFSPDLIISDCEPIVACIANLLKIPLWYCSSALLAQESVISKFDYFYKFQIMESRRYLKLLPKAEKYLIYSPFERVKVLRNRKNSKWILPYFEEKSIDKKSIVLNSRKKDLTRIIEASDFDGKISNIVSSNWTFLQGNSSIITDSLSVNSTIVCSPSSSNIEECMNASILRESGLGIELGQIDFLGKTGVSFLNDSLKFNTKPNFHPEGIFLHEEIEHG